MKDNLNIQNKKGRLVLIILVSILIVGVVSGGAVGLLKSGSSSSGGSSTSLSTDNNGADQGDDDIEYAYLEYLDISLSGAFETTLYPSSSFDGIGSVELTTSGNTYGLGGSFVPVHVFRGYNYRKDGLLFYYPYVEYLSYDYTPSLGRTLTFYVPINSFIYVYAQVINWKNASLFNPSFFNYDQVNTELHQYCLFQITQECWITLYPTSGDYVEAPEEFLPFDNWE